MRLFATCRKCASYAASNRCSLATLSLRSPCARALRSGAVSSEQNTTDARSYRHERQAASWHQTQHERRPWARVALRCGTRPPARELGVAEAAAIEVPAHRHRPAQDDMPSTGPCYLRHRNLPGMHIGCCIRIAVLFLRTPALSLHASLRTPFAAGEFAIRTANSWMRAAFN